MTLVIIRAWSVCLQAFYCEQKSVDPLWIELLKVKVPSSWAVKYFSYGRLFKWNLMGFSEL